MELILHQIRRRRSSGFRISVMNTRPIIMGYLRIHAPELLEAKGKDGQKFNARESFVRKLLDQELDYAPRTGTHAAQKTPANANEQMRGSYTRIAYTTATQNIQHADLIVNADQTQVVVQDTSTSTFAERGSKQVDVVGKDEKRAWTALVAASAGGKVLPLQIIMKGKTARSLPPSSAPRMDEARERGITFVLNPKTYWSNLDTMKSWVTDTLVPFWTDIKKEKGLSTEQPCILFIDSWSVHRSIDFRRWLRVTYPWIYLEFVPGGCTGLWQPMDVGLQKPFKASIKNSQNEDSVLEAMGKLETTDCTDDEDPPLELDDTIGTLRKRGVGWFVDSMDCIQRPDLVKRSFARCATSEGFNLSFESLTSTQALRLLLDIQLRQPALWAQLTAGRSHVLEEDDTTTVDGEEDSPFQLDGQEGDDENVTSDPADLIRAVLASHETGSIGWDTTEVEAEQLEPKGISVPPPSLQALPPPSKRQRH
jgi:hypothetical protein